MTAIDKAFQLVEILGAADHPLGLGELVTASGLPKPTVRRLLVDLTRQSFVMQDGRRRYELGNGLVDIAARAMADMTLPEESREILLELRENVAGTITLSRFAHDGLVPIMQIDASRSAFLVSPTPAIPPQMMASGKAVLAFLPQVDVDRIARARSTQTSAPMRPNKALARDLESVRQRGYAIEDEEARPGVRAVAAPIRTFVHRPIGAVSVSSASELVSIDQLNEMASHVVAAADDISARLGGQPLVTVAGA